MNNNQASDKLARQKVSYLTGKGTQLRGEMGELGKQIDNRNNYNGANSVQVASAKSYNP
jgi:hypothetical protein